MTEQPNGTPRAKKSVALSGVSAGETAICTVGSDGDGLSYRGYEIREFADRAAFEEVAHLLIHERLPSAEELASYRAALRAARRGTTPALRPTAGARG